MAVTTPGLGTKSLDSKGKMNQAYGVASAADVAENVSKSTKPTDRNAQAVKVELSDEGLAASRQHKSRDDASDVDDKGKTKKTKAKKNKKEAHDVEEEKEDLVDFYAKQLKKATDKIEKTEGAEAGIVDGAN